MINKMNKKSKKTRNLAHNLALCPRNRSTRNLAHNLALCPRNRSAQEEMVGFVIIVVLVSIALLILLGFLLRSPTANAVESYEVESFIQASLQYTSDCENEAELLNLQDLIVSCEVGEICLDGRESCTALNETLMNLIDNGWNAGSESAVKGYELGIKVEGEDMLMLQGGNATSDYKGNFQDFEKRGDTYEVSLKVYY